MGFETTPGGVVAFAGEQRMSIDVPEGSTLKWQARTKKHTRFSTNMRRVGQYTLWGVAGVGALVLDGVANDVIDDAMDRATNEKARRKRGNGTREAYKSRDHESDFRLFRDLYFGAMKEAAEK